MLQRLLETGGMSASRGNDLLVSDGYFLQANAFDAKDMPQETVLYSRPVGVQDGPLFGWTADYSKIPVGYSVRGYPSCIYGWKPWMADTSTPDFPVRLADSAEVGLFCDWQAEGKRYNVTWDLWITSGPRPSEQTIIAEVMILLYSQDINPAGLVVNGGVPGTYLNGKRYLSPAGHSRPWPIHTFAIDPDIQTQSLHVPVGAVLQELTRSDDPYPIDPTGWLADAEIGTEILGGGSVVFVANNHRVSVVRRT